MLSAEALDIIFREARSCSNGWLDKDVSEDQIHAIYELLKMAPTSANMQPARIVWAKSSDAKEKLAALAMDGNKDKITSAPVVAIIGYDIDFHEELPWLFPHTDAKSWFEGDEEGRKEGAFRNSSLQGAYLMIAARAWASTAVRCPVSTMTRSMPNSSATIRVTAAISSARSAMATARAFSSAARVPNSTSSIASPDLQPRRCCGSAMPCVSSR